MSDKTSLGHAEVKHETDRAILVVLENSIPLCGSCLEAIKCPFCALMKRAPSAPSTGNVCQCPTTGEM